MSKGTATTVGVISDTHGLMRPEALAALAGVDRIIHAGDVGSPDVLTALAALAPVTAVRGNNDHSPWARHLPERTTVVLGEARLHVLHDLNELALDPAAAYAAVIAGHSHRPAITERDGVVFVNPGSAGPRRFKLPVAVARLQIRGRVVRGEVILLGV